MGARPPHHLVEFLTGAPTPPLDTQTIQPYYTARLAANAGMRLDVLKDGPDIVLAARS